MKTLYSIIETTNTEVMNINELAAVKGGKRMIARSSGNVDTSSFD